MQILRLDHVSDGRHDPAIKDYYIGPSFLGKMPPEKNLDTFRGILRDKDTVDVFDWWLSLVKDGLPPKKSSILLRDMGRFAKNIGLVICTPDGKAQFRLAGSGIEELAGRSLGGFDVNEASPLSTELCQLAWQTQIEERRLRYYTRDLRHFDKEYRNVCILELPVSDGDLGRYKYVLSYITALPTPH
ncbi:PAS domain-containing protein [Kordiimonas aquimaris]|uniref:PAS domain-containing protein n=1 Tax=Kordiimonas aquimaris TaxID=707591 RepID=UPI0021D1A65C|nr:PAS domain-containing protein [Kordiimonas aquimaris]